MRFTQMFADMAKRMDDNPNPIVAMLKQMRVTKDTRQARHPVEKLKILLEIASPETKTLIEPLLEIVQDLQERIAMLECRSWE